MKKQSLTLTLGLILSGLPAMALSNSDAEFAGALNAIDASVVKDAKASFESAQAAIPQAQSADSVIRDQTTTVPVSLNAQTVKCSAADYQMPMLKVLVPALAELTVLNHRNTREGAPCIAAGRCGPIGPQDVLKSGEGVDQVPVRVILKKEFQIDGDVCHVSLVEKVSASVRGIPFFHERRQAVAERSAADCR